MYFLDIHSTGAMPKFKTEPEVMQEFYRTHLECTAYNDDEPIAEKYLIEGDDGFIMEEVIFEEDAEYAEL